MVVVETTHTPSFSLGPSSPDTVLRPRRSPQLLDEKELMSQLRQVRGGIRVGGARAQRGTSWSFLASLNTLFVHPGALAEDGRDRL